MNLKNVINPILVIISLSVALENFINIGLLWKLVAIVICTGIALYNASNLLEKWVKPKTEIVVTTPLPKSKKRIALSILALFMICLIFFGLTFFVVDKNVIRVIEKSSSDKTSTFEIKGAFQIATQAKIFLPQRSISTCIPIGPKHDRADDRMVNYDKKIPHIVLSNFSSHQSLLVDCTPPITLDIITVRAKPPKIEIIMPFKWNIYIRWILITGGILWIASIALLSIRLRRF